VHVDIDGEMYRIYFEESGEGIPLVCLHTAGSDGRQWRHLLADKELREEFRIIAFDMPWHGKSNPPASWDGTDISSRLRATRRPSAPSARRCNWTGRW
jgi:pimeloyl-ACP methyl ester carboxylesterase